MNMQPNIFCSWHLIEDQKFIKYRCIYCANTITVLDDYPEPPVMICRKTFLANHTHGSETDKIRDFVAQVSEPSIDMLCDKEETNYRYSLCSSCEFLINNTCQKCGCLMMKDKVFLDKLTLKDQHCPINRW